MRKNEFICSQIGREHLVAMGSCIGRMTHGGRFHLTIGALDVLQRNAKYKVLNTDSGCIDNFPQSNCRM